MMYNLAGVYNTFSLRVKNSYFWLGPALQELYLMLLRE